MFDTPTSHNIGDFKQRYLGVFGWLCQEQKRVVYISGVTSKQVTFTDVDGAQFYAHTDSGVSFEFAPVTRGWYATPSNTYYLSRVPARQWKRGIAEENTTISLPSNVGLHLLGSVWHAAIFDVLLHPDYQTTNNTIKPMSRHFCRVNTGLYLYDQVIGQFMSDSVVRLKDDMFRQEFTDLCRRKNLNLEVV